MDRTPPKALRADAQRNRQQLLEVARRAFGDEGEVSLEAIAKRAGVGIGTLYRHFPTREALVEAVYRDQLARLQASADELLESRHADDAMRGWMDNFADWVAAKQGMVETLRAMIASGTITASETRDGLTTTIDALLQAGAAAGTVRGDVDPRDVLASLTGILLAAGGPDNREQAGRMLDLLMDGLRTHHDGTHA